MSFPVRRWTPVFSLLLCACGSSEPPVPSIVSVAPTRISSSECVLMTVELEGALPVKLDYGSDSAELAKLAQLRVGEREVPLESIQDKGRHLAAHLFSGLPPGMHEVRVTLADGQQLVAPDAVEVTGRLLLDTFQIDSIGPQVRDTPFPITLRATGPDAQRFQGRVLLRSNKGKLEPEWSNLFQNGVLTQEVSIDAGGGNVLIEMVDCEGRMVSSNEFQLAPKP